MKWSYKLRSIDELKPQEKNPRKISKEQKKQLSESITKFGCVEPIVITKDGTIIGGHQRYFVLKAKGTKQVECMECEDELDTKQVDELTVRLNQNKGEFDFDLLAGGYDALDLIDWGFTEKELQVDFEGLKGKDEPDDDFIEPPKDPITKKGDLYILGDHRLLCGDSTNPDDVSRLLDGQEPILMVTDPPYGVDYDPKWRTRIKKQRGKKLTVSYITNDTTQDWSLAWVLFPGSVAYVWHASMFGSTVQKSLEDADFKFVSQIIWVKQHLALSRGNYNFQHEPCFYFVKRGHNHNWQGSHSETTTWGIPNLNSFGTSTEDERTSHSTQKPIECMRRPIKNNSRLGEGVYDPFCGSGTTLVACEETGRRCFAMEIEPKFCDVIVERWKKYRRKLGLNDDDVRVSKPEEED